MPGTAGIRIPPPVIPLGVIGLAAGLHVLLDLPSWTAPWARWLGVAVLAGAVAWAIWAAVVMVRAGTSPEPWKPTKRLVTAGPFRWGRNPIYAAYLVGQLGLGLAADWWLCAAFLPVTWAALRYGVIAKEEPYLTGLFGQAYAAYCRDVRRWL